MFFGSFFRQVDSYALYAGRLRYDGEDEPKDKAIFHATLLALLNNPGAQFLYLTAPYRTIFLTFSQISVFSLPDMFSNAPSLLETSSSIFLNRNSNLLLDPASAVSG